jgi:AAA+ superfamily predicted ATPase
VLLPLAMTATTAALENVTPPPLDRVLALSGCGRHLALRHRRSLRLIDGAGDRAPVELAEDRALDFLWSADRLWVATPGEVKVFDPDGSSVASLAMEGASLAPALGEAAVLVAGREPRRLRLEGDAIAVDRLGAAAPGERILASLGGLRTLRASGREIRAADPGRLVHRVVLPGTGSIAEAGAILEGGAIAVASRVCDGLDIDVIRLPGGRIHRLAIPGARRLVLAPARGRAVAATDGGEIVALDLRYGRVTHRIAAPLQACAVDIDESGEALAIAGHRDAGARLSAFLVPFAELFAGAQLLPEPRPQPRAPLKSIAATVPPAIEPADESAALAIPDRPLVALMLPTPPRPSAPVPAARPYDDDTEHLGDLLDLACARAARAVAEAWNRGALAAPAPGVRPGEIELRALSEAGGGQATGELERWSRRVRELEDEIARRAQATLSGGDRLALHDLLAQFGLSSLATRVLVAVLAPAVCPEAARLHAALANDVTRPACDRALVLQLLAGFDWRARERVVAELAPDRPLLARGLIVASPDGGDGDLFSALSIDSALVERLRGQLVGHRPGSAATLVRADRELGELAIPAALLAPLLEILATPASRPIRIVVSGRPGLGGTCLLAALAARADRPLALIDADRLPRGDLLAEALRRELIRGLLRGAIPCVRGLDQVGADDDPGQRAHLRALFRDFEGTVAFRAGAGGELPIDPGFLSMSLPTPSESARLDHWRRATARAGLEAMGLDDLARRYRIGAGTIERVVAEVAAADLEGDAGGAIESAARQRIAAGLGALATRVERLARLDQVALPPETLDSIKELVARARQRRIVFETWGFDEVVSSSRGLTALFSGPPGTGKTMVAGAIARELELDLFRVDLARVSSKWIGETEKNLGRIFDAAEDGQAVILFDEADSLFSRRTAVKSSIDRHSNMEVNYLLQRLDSFEGIAILTTNQATAIDGAFRRRLSLRLAFPFPDEETRTELWRAHLPEAAPVAGELDVAALARKFPMTGGYIRNSVLRAAFLAAAENTALSQEHLMRAVHLEYSDMGKLAAGGRLE